MPDKDLNEDSKEISFVDVYNFKSKNIYVCVKVSLVPEKSLTYHLYFQSLSYKLRSIVNVLNTVVCVEP